MKQRTLSLILTLCCLLTVWGITPLQVYAETEGIFTYTVSDGVATITLCDKSASGDIIIPDTLGGCPVTVIAARAFSGRSKITGIVFPDSVTTLEYASFEKCSALTDIVWPNSLTTRIACRLMASIERRSGVFLSSASPP